MKYMFENNKKTFSFVAEVSGETDKLMHANHDGDMPVLMLRDNIFFPGTVSPITVGRKHSIKTLNKLERTTDGLVAHTDTRLANGCRRLRGNRFEHDRCDA